MAEVIVILAFFYLIYKLFTVKGGYSKEQVENILVKGLRPVCHSLVTDIQKEYDKFKNSPDSFEYPTFESYLLAKHEEIDQDFDTVISKLKEKDSTK